MSPAVKQMTFRQTLLDALFDVALMVWITFLGENTFCCYPQESHGFRLPLRIECAIMNRIIFFSLKVPEEPSDAAC